VVELGRLSGVLGSYPNLHRAQSALSRIARSAARPQDGYPYEASYVADNDYALGRIVEFLSRAPQWREMAMFATEDDAQGGRDHIDAHRTVFLGIGPYFKRGYVSRVKTTFRGC
jgi:hypothetical protein